MGDKRYTELGIDVWLHIKFDFKFKLKLDLKFNLKFDLVTINSALNRILR